MKEILDVLVLIAFIFVLFFLIKGMTKGQIKKHEDKINKNNDKKDNKNE